MNYILDTHVFLWFVNDDSRISEKAKELIEDRRNIIHLSSAVVWEISIKTRIGKINLETGPDGLISESIQAYNLRQLPITISHAVEVYNLKDIHKDPFDRILIAQSIVTNYPIITSDQLIKKYKIKTIW